MGRELPVPGFQLTGYPTKAPREFPSAARLRFLARLRPFVRCRAVCINNSNWIRLSIIVSPPKNSVITTRFNFASRLLEVVDLALLARVMYLTDQHSSWRSERVHLDPSRARPAMGVRGELREQWEFVLPCTRAHRSYGELLWRAARWI